MADTLPRCWPRASLVWPSLSDQEEGIPSLASPSFGHGVSLLLLAPDSTPFIPLLTGWFPCSLVGSGSPCSLVSSPWSWASPLAPIRPPHLAYGQQHLSTAPARLSSQTWTLLHVSGLEVSNASHSQYTSTTVLDSRPTRPTDTSPDPAASKSGLSLAPETGEGPGTLAWSHHQALTGAAGGLAEQKA